MPRSRKSLYADDYETLLDLLRAMREKSGVTQVELSTQIGTSQSMLSKIERGVVRMDISDLLDYLLGIGAAPVEFMKSYLKAIGWNAKKSQVKTR
jgi:transcriptional regulator with XRE-family HTH domain